MLNIYQLLVLTLLEPFELKVLGDILHHNFINFMHAFKNVFETAHITLDRRIFIDISNELIFVFELEIVLKRKF